ncbi:hypothetical protein BD779DRAFT_1789301 [Infundibulicybe gibba]|nr:hypothetical protein BD779DRAFT_1789301 [Infundibulicybe gibba]
MSTELLLILDDKSSLIEYGGGKWSVHADARWSGGTSTWPQFAIDTQGTFGSLGLAFQGTSIAFIGNTPPAQQPQNITVTIDGGTPYNTSYNDPHPQNYLQWYQSPILADGAHKLILDGIAGTSVDFAVISAGPKTPLDSNQKVIVDDDSPEIQYSGKWTRNGDPFVCSENPNGFPFHNGTHQSTLAGDVASFRFAGTTVAVFGIFSWMKIGSLAATYTLDGSPIVNTYSVAPTTPEFINGLRQHQNYLLFSNDSLPAGNHSLVINVTQANGLVFAMDYITYTPSFTSLGSKPNLTQSSPSSESSSADEGPPPTGAIIGVIIGTLVLLCTIFALFIISRRRRRKEKLLPETVSPYNVFGQGTNVLTLEPRGSATSQQKHRLEWVDAAASSATLPAALTPRQLEIQRRMQELESLIAMQGTARSDDTDRQIAQLRTRVNELLQENERLGGVPPLRMPMRYSVYMDFFVMVGACIVWTFWKLNIARMKWNNYLTVYCPATGKPNLRDIVSGRRDLPVPNHLSHINHKVGDVRYLPYPHGSCGPVVVLGLPIGTHS